MMKRVRFAEILADFHHVDRSKRQYRLALRMIKKYDFDVPSLKTSISKAVSKLKKKPRSTSSMRAKKLAQKRKFGFE